MRAKWTAGLIVFCLILNLISGPVFAASSFQSQITDLRTSHAQINIEEIVSQEEVDQGNIVDTAEDQAINPEDKQTEEDQAINPEDNQMEEDQAINPEDNQMEEDQAINPEDKQTEEDQVINPEDKQTEEDQVINPEDKTISKPEIEEKDIRGKFELIEKEFVVEEIVQFNDANLEMAVRKALNKPEDVIFKDDLFKIKKLIATGQDIKDLTGLEYATNLKILYLNTNQISDITPLILNNQNGGFGKGTYINLCDNPLDLEEGSNTIRVIEQLIEAGTSVDYDKVIYDSEQLKLNRDIEGLRILSEKIGEKSKRQVLVQYKDESSKNQSIQNYFSKIEKVEALTEEIEIIAVKKDENIDAFISELKKDNAIVYVEKNRLMSYYQAPNDTFYSYQWGLRNIKAEEAWAKTSSLQKSIIIASIDSGADLYHDDLKNRIAPGAKDFFFDDDLPLDFIGHGTAVAGLIAAETNNNAGIAGVSGTLDVKVLPLCISDPEGNIYLSHIISAIDYAILKKVDVINLSLGSESFSSLENAAVQRAIQAGIVVVAAAGNEGTSAYQYPASYDNVISVGSIDDTNTRSSFSNYNDKISVVAPGRNILSTKMGWRTYETGNYTYYMGTSFSAPMVAAIAGVLKGTNPSITPAQIKNRLQTTAVDLGATGKDNYYGYGRVNFHDALGSSSTSSLNAQITNISVPNSVTVGQNFTIQVTVKNTGTENWSEASQIRLGIRGATEARGVIPRGVAIGSNGAYVFSVNLTAPSTAGSMNLTFQMIKEGVAWFGEEKSAVVSVAAATNPLCAQITSVSVPSSVTPGQSFAVTVAAKNTGTENWTYSNQIRLGIRGSIETRGLIPSGVTIRPGDTYVFSVNLTAPSTAGSMNLTFQMIKEGVAWFGEEKSAVV
ncbi:MAG: S8 family serine peptidase, partial [Tissierellaceae bacterium]